MTYLKRKLDNTRGTMLSSIGVMLGMAVMVIGLHLASLPTMVVSLAIGGASVVVKVATQRSHDDGRA